MALPEPYYDHYPYEKLTSKHTADLLRLSDRQYTDLNLKYQKVCTELYFTQQRLDRLLGFLRGMGASEEVLIETAKVFE